MTLGKDPASRVLALEAALAKAEQALERARSERIALESQLRESEERNVRLYRDAPVMLHSIDREGKLISVSDRWLEVLGYARDEVIGRPSTDFLTEDSRRYAREVILPDYFETGVCRDVAYQMVTKDGAIREVLLSAIAEQDGEGRHQRSFAVMTDITEQKRIEAGLHESQKLESLGVLSGGIAHDFNNLLMGIYGFLDLAVLELEPGTQAHRFVAEAKKAAQHSASLIEQLLVYAGRRATKRSGVDLRALVLDMAELLRTSISKKSVLDLEALQDAPLVEGDATQLRQVIMNLVTNAAQAIGDGAGTIRVSLQPVVCERSELAALRPDARLPEGDYVRLEVADSGPGIPAPLRSRIFDPFFSTKDGGSGLGLAAVHGIVRGHRGAIRVDSLSGARFTIYLPAAAEEELRPSSNPPASRYFDGGGRVLLADDEPIVLRSAASLLKRFGFEVTPVGDGRKAVERFREEPDQFRLAIVDYKMPGLDGEETFRALREIRSDIPVLLSSGYAEADIRRLVGDGLSGFIQKPYSLDDLKQLLSKILSKKGAASQPK